MCSIGQVFESQRSLLWKGSRWLPWFLQSNNRCCFLVCFLLSHISADPLWLFLRLRLCLTGVSNKLCVTEARKFNRCSRFQSFSGGGQPADLDATFFLPLLINWKLFAVFTPAGCQNRFLPRSRNGRGGELHFHCLFSVLTCFSWPSRFLPQP